MKNSHSVILCLGTNVQQKENMMKAQQLLRAEYTSITFTPSIWTEPIGVISPPYLNCMAEMKTNDDLEILHDKTKNIERLMHSCPKERKDNIVRIDIDIMCYDNHIYHKDDWSRDYVKQLSENLHTPLHL